jgi:hypothetical protein
MHAATLHRHKPASNAYSIRVACSNQPHGGRDQSGHWLWSSQMGFREAAAGKTGTDDDGWFRLPRRLLCAVWSASTTIGILRWVPVPPCPSGLRL